MHADPPAMLTLRKSPGLPTAAIKSRYREESAAARELALRSNLVRRQIRETRLRVGLSKVISANECREYAAECRRLATAPNISIQRAAILLALARSWDELASQIEQYDTILREEGE
jgi:hypothetical protein